MILPETRRWLRSCIFQILVLILIWIHRDTTAAANFNKCMRASSTNTLKFSHNSRHVLILQILAEEKLGSARRSLIGRPTRLSASENFRTAAIFSEYSTKMIKLLWDSHITNWKSNMASVGPKVVKQLSFFQKCKSAFLNWYVYACGYRQLGKFFCQREIHFIQRSLHFQRSKRHHTWGTNSSFEASANISLLILTIVVILRWKILKKSVNLIDTTWVLNFLRENKLPEMWTGINYYVTNWTLNIPV